MHRTQILDRVLDVCVVTSSSSHNHHARVRPGIDHTAQHLRQLSWSYHRISVLTSELAFDAILRTRWTNWGWQQIHTVALARTHTHAHCRLPLGGTSPGRSGIACSSSHQNNTSAGGSMHTAGMNETHCAHELVRCGLQTCTTESATQRSGEPERVYAQNNNNSAARWIRPIKRGVLTATIWARRHRLAHTLLL